MVRRVTGFLPGGQATPERAYWLPAFARELDPGIRQLHAGDYRNPGQFAPGPVLIAGAGNSGAEIAKDRVKAAPPTVYRALDFLLEHGLVHRLESLNAFIGCDHPEDRHISQFLICTSCHKAIGVADRAIFDAAKSCAQRQGFQVTRLTIEIEGLCPACTAAQGSAA